MNGVRGSTLVLALVLFGAAIGTTVPVVLQAQELPKPPEADVTGPVVTVVLDELVTVGSSASSQGEVERREVTIFDEENGRILRQERYAPRDSLRSRSAFEYDDAGRLVQVRSHDGDGVLQWRREYRYTDWGDLEREISHGPSGRIELVTAYQYAAGELEQVTQYRFGTEVLWRRVYRRDDDGALSWDLVGAEGERIRQVRQRFDERQRPVLQQSFDQMGAIWEEVRHRYEDGREVVRRYGPGEQLLEERITHFDLQDSPIRQEVRRGNSEAVSVVTHEYRYDRNGNWVERYTVHFGEDGQITRRIEARRRIEYPAGGGR
ncbi:MAG: hypothetical protein EA403_15020 [Spirochaetaceae bacterium]|nr:MAG: hypothetical protein EA403_15020 [Spirochaetaceae bacterium]